MHNTVKRIINKIKKLERMNLNEDQQKVLASLKATLAIFQARQAKGLAFSSGDETILNALEVFVDYMVKDSSIT